MIMLYSKPGCPQCKMSARRLDDRQIDYRMINILDDKIALNHFKNEGYSQLPIIVKDRNVVTTGFRPDVIDRLA